MSMDEIENYRRLRRVLPMLEALAIGLRVQAQGETWTISEDLELVVVVSGYRLLPDGREEAMPERGVLPMGGPSLKALVEILESVSEDSRRELLADLSLNKITHERFSHREERSGNQLDPG